MPRKVVPTLSLGDMLDSVVDELDTSVTSIYAYHPHEKQYEFHKSDLMEKLFIGGNRSGKTVGNVCECIWRITKTHPFRPELNEIEGEIRGRLVCVSFVDGLEKIILPLFKKWMPKKYLISRSWDKSYNRYLRTLTLEDGSFIEFMSYDQELEKFAGTSRHFVSFDEEPPKSVWEECLLRLVDTDGDWWISMTPVEGLTWVFDLIYQPWEEGNRPETLVLKVSMDDNPHLKETAKSKILKNIVDEADRQARKEGSFVQIKGLVYKSFDPHIHKRKNFQLHPSMRIYTSLDTGWRHPAAWLWHAVEPNGRITTFHEIVESERTVESLAAEVHAFESKVLRPLGMEVFLRTGDPAMLQTKEHTGTSIVGEYAKHNIFIGVEGVPKGPGSVDIGVTKLTQYMTTPSYDGPCWGYTEDCPVLEKQMKNLRWELYESKKMEYKKAPKTTIDKKNDDAPDSLRYFITLTDDLTPETIADIQKNPNLLPSVPYYNPYAPPIPDYQVYQSSNLYGIEGL
jgi:phage terminase large subunit-like protein